MALDKEFLTGVFEGIENAGERIEKILKEHDSDTTGLKVNKESVLAEKKALEEKYRNLETSSAGYQAAIKELEEKIKSSGSGDTKQFYEAEIKKIQEMNAAKLAEGKAKAAEQETAYNDLRKKYLDSLVSVELEKAISESNVRPDMRVHLHKLFVAENRFEPTVVDGVEKILTADGQFRNVKDALNAYLGTNEGKVFLQPNSTGGGATGSGTPKPPSSANPWAKGSVNLTEQARILKENPTMAASLKAQAGAPAK